MNEVLHANIFFVIASIATVLFSIIVCFILYHVYKMVRTARRIIDRIEAGSEAIADDVAHLRSFMAQGGLVTKMLQFFMGSRDRSRKSGKRSKS